MSLTLLSPLMLLAGLGIVVPVLIHLLQRRREVVLPFAMVRFIVLARKRSARRLRLRRVFLLLLRAGAVAVLALVLARPVLLTADARLTAGRKGRTVVIVDNSLSMGARPGGGETHLSTARRALAEYLSQAAPGARFAVLAAAGGDADPEWLAAGDALSRAEGFALRADRGDLNATFSLAHSLLHDAGGGERRIAVFTDFSWGSWSDFGYGKVEGGDLGVPVEIFRAGPAAGSAGITDIAIEGEHGVSGGKIAVRAEVYSALPDGEIAVDLFAGERRVDRQIITTVGGGTATATFSAVDLPPGETYLSVRLESDEYAADDSRSTALSLSAPIRVLLVDGDPGRSLIESETFFLSEALSPAVPFGDEPILAVVTGREEAAREGLDNVDVLVLANYAPRGELDVGAFVARGGGVAVFWGDRCRFRDFDMYLPGLLPGEVTGVEEAHDGKTFRPESGYGEIFSPFRSPESGSFSSASFYYRAAFRPGSGAETAAAFSDGNPWVVTARRGAGRVAFVASSADIQWNDLPTKPVFVPFARRLVLSLADRLGGASGRDVAAGEVMPIRGGEGDSFGAAAVYAPDGTVRSVEFHPDGESVLGLFRGTEGPGRYRYRWEGGAGSFAVNPPAEESYVRRLTDGEVESRFQRVRLEVVDIDGRETVTGYSQKGAVSLSSSFFLALLALLLVEMIVAGPRVNPFARQAKGS